MSEKDPAEGRAVSWQSAADVEIYGHDALGRGPGDVNDFAFLQHGGRCRFLERCAHLLEDGLDCLGQRRRRKKRIAEAQNLRPQEESPAIRADIAELLESVETAPCGSPRQSADFCDLRDHEIWLLRSERADDRQSARDGGHEVRVIDPHAIALWPGSGRRRLIITLCRPASIVAFSLTKRHRRSAFDHVICAIIAHYHRKSPLTSGILSHRVGRISNTKFDYRPPGGDC